MKICFLDTETTGLSNGRLVQLAYEVYDSEDTGSNGLCKNCTYKPPVPIELEAMATHHITEKMVADMPPFSPEWLPELLEKYIFTAHNARFDLDIMQREGVEKPKYYIDTLKVAQTYIDLPSYKLQYLRYYFGLEIEAVAHDAYGDILVLKEVFFKLLSVMQETEKLTDQEAIAKMVQISKNPVEVRRFTFGKHKGKTFAEVSSFDIAYLQWLKSDTLKKPKEEQDENLIYTLSLYL